MIPLVPLIIDVIDRIDVDNEIRKDDQRHLCSNLSSAHGSTDKRLKNDDIRGGTLKGKSLKKNISPKLKLKPSSIKKPNVKLIIGQFDPKKKYVERKEVKLSPKPKISPNKGRKLSAMNRLDGTPPPHKGGDAKKSDVRLTPKNKLKLGPKIEPKMVIEPNRVKKIISAIEDH